MFRKIRITVAVISLTILTFLFLDFTGTAHLYFSWFAKIQFIPAMIAFNTAAVIAIIALTLIAGRIYCSVICPLGVFQDSVSHIASKLKKNIFSFAPQKWLLRYGFLAVFVLLFFAGGGFVFSLLEPYSAYGRIASELFSPVYQWGNDLLSMLSDHVSSYLFYPVDIRIKGFLPFFIAIATFGAVFTLAWRGGRTYCNTVCPAGTILGFFARFSFFKPVIDTDSCNSCGLCAKRCKASCIDSKMHSIDYSRCVMCLNCTGTCPRNAIKILPIKLFRLKKENSEIGAAPQSMEAGLSRRAFLSIASLFTLTTVVKAQTKKVEGGLAIIKNRNLPARSGEITPPGSQGIRNFERHCSFCHLCVSVCPNQVLTPSSSSGHLMLPLLSYSSGFCRPECVKCSEVCPTGAIRRIKPSEKSSIQIGHAVWIQKNCVNFTDHVSCDSCARHCPSGAIQMIPSEEENLSSQKMPLVNTERCIGCGACEYLCPARPFGAMYVEGHEKHRTV